MRSRRLTDVGRVLEAAESASPVEAVEGVAFELGLAFDAVAVSFLIADLSGRALVRLAHVPVTGQTSRPGTLSVGERRDEEESAARSRPNADLHPRGLVRALADTALAAAGHALEDDATVLCLDWHGTHDESRVSVLGADPDRATSPLA